MPRFAGRKSQSDLSQELRGVEIKRVPLVMLLRAQLSDIVVKPGNLNRTVFVIQATEDLRQHAYRVARRAAVHSGMEVAGWTGDDHLAGAKAAQHGRDRRRVGIPLAGVANEREVLGEFIPIGFKEGREARTAGLFLAFDQDRNRDRQATRRVMPGAARLEERHELALVVGRAAAADHRSVYFGSSLTSGSKGGVSHLSSGSAGCTS